MKKITINPCREKERQIKIKLPTLLNPKNGVDKIAKVKIENVIGINIEKEIAFTEDDNSLFTYLHCIAELNKKLKNEMGENYTLPLNIEVCDRITDFEESEMHVTFPNKTENITYLTKRQLFINKDIKAQLRTQLHRSSLNPDEYQILLNNYQKFDVYMYCNNNIPVNIQRHDQAWTIIYRKNLNLTAAYFALLADSNDLEFGFEVRWEETKSNEYYNKMLIVIYGGHKKDGDF